MVVIFPASSRKPPPAPRRATAAETELALAFILRASALLRTMEKQT